MKHTLVVVTIVLTLFVGFRLGTRASLAQGQLAPAESPEISAVIPSGFGGTVYVFLKNGDVYRSLDRGETWKRTGNVFVEKK